MNSVASHQQGLGWVEYLQLSETVPLRRAGSLTLNFLNFRFTVIPSYLFDILLISTDLFFFSACELLCNLSSSEKYIESLKSERGPQKMKLFGISMNIMYFVCCECGCEVMG